MKMSIKRYMQQKWGDLHKLIQQKLTNVDEKKQMTPKAVAKAKEFYDYFIDQVIQLYEIIDDSVDTLVEVWNSLVKI